MAHPLLSTSGKRSPTSAPTASIDAESHTAGNFQVLCNLWYWRITGHRCCGDCDCRVRTAALFTITLPGSSVITQGWLALTAHRVAHTLVTEFTHSFAEIPRYTVLSLICVGMRKYMPANQSGAGPGCVGYSGAGQKDCSPRTRHIALHTLQIKNPVQLGRPSPYHQPSFGQRVMEAGN